MNNNFLKQNDKKPLKKRGFFSVLLNNFFPNEIITREELLDAIKKSAKNSLIDNYTKDMLEGVMNITQKKVKNVMIPISQIVTLKINFSIEQCLDIIIRSAHSRFPVMSKNNDDIKGFLIAKDLLIFMQNKQKDFNLKNLLRPSIVVPESKNIENMLTDFRLKKYHMAMVVDEFGIFSGLLTIEDILELIVGEIEDEYDKRTYKFSIKRIKKKSFLIQSMLTINQFNKFFNTKLSNNHVDTIGGLVMKLYGRLPKKGEKIYIEGIKFKISTTDGKKIINLKVKIPKELSEKIKI